MYSEYKYKDVSVVIHDTSQPGRISIRKADGRRDAIIDMTVHEAVEMATDILNGARMQGYELVARKRADR